MTDDECLMKESDGMANDECRMKEFCLFLKVIERLSDTRRKRLRCASEFLN